MSFSFISFDLDFFIEAYWSAVLNQEITSRNSPNIMKTILLPLFKYSIAQKCLPLVHLKTIINICVLFVSLIDI